MESDIDMLTWKNIYQTKYAELPNGEKIAYREAGEGEIPLLLIHGHLSCSLTMENLMGKLSPKVRVIAICLRGFGYSSYNSKITSMKDFA